MNDTAVDLIFSSAVWKGFFVFWNASFSLWRTWLERILSPALRLWEKSATQNDSDSYWINSALAPWVLLRGSYIRLAALIVLLLLLLLLPHLPLFINLYVRLNSRRPAYKIAACYLFPRSNCQEDLQQGDEQESDLESMNYIKSNRILSVIKFILKLYRI